MRPALAALAALVLLAACGRAERGRILVAQQQDWPILLALDATNLFWSTAPIAGN